MCAAGISIDCRAVKNGLGVARDSRTAGQSMLDYNAMKPLATSVLETNGRALIDSRVELARPPRVRQYFCDSIKADQ